MANEQTKQEAAVETPIYATRKEFDAIVNTIQSNQKAVQAELATVKAELAALKSQQQGAKNATDGNAAKVATSKPNSFEHDGKTYRISKSYADSGKLPTEKGFVKIEGLTPEQKSDVIQYHNQNPKIGVLEK